MKCFVSLPQSARADILCCKMTETRKMESSAPASPPSASNPCTPPFSQAQPNPQGDVVDNVVVNVQEKKADVVNDFLNFDSAEDNEKFMKYEADYARRLMSKYFSKKDIYGGNIYNETMTTDGQIIKSSRWPCTRSYADPVLAFEDMSSSVSTSEEEAMFHISNGRRISKSG